MNKKIILMFMFGMFLFSFGSVSAADWDNTISYEENDMKVKIKNTFGLGAELGTATLKSHNSPTHIREVSFGSEQVVMYYDFEGWKAYKDGLGEVYFTDQRAGEDIEKDYVFVEWVVKDVEINDYDEKCKFSTKTCKNNVIGSHTEQIGEWVELNTDDIPGRNARIGLKTYVAKDDHIDAVWTIAGKKVKKHASWIASLSVSLDAYYSLDETTGTLIVDNATNYNGTAYNGTTVGAVGKLSNGLYMNGNEQYIGIPTFNRNGFSSISGCAWINATNFGSLEENNPIIGGDDASWGNGERSFFFSLQAGDDSSTGTPVIVMFADGTTNLMATGNFSANTTWHHTCFTYSNNNLSLWVDGSLNATTAGETGAMDGGEGIAIGSLSDERIDFFYDGFIDEVGIWSKALTALEISTLWNNGDGIYYLQPDAPTITLNSPIAAFNTTNPTITFNATISSVVPINVTLYLDDVLNETNSSGLEGDYLFTKTLSEGNHNWIIESCSATSCGNSSTRIFSIDFSAPTITIQSPNETFGILLVGQSLWLNFTAADAVSIDSCLWDYNGTNISADCSKGVQYNVTIGQETDNFNVTVYVNDTAGNVNSNSTSWSANLFETGSSASNFVKETDNETFLLNITIPSDITAISSVLQYNGTANVATSICTGTACQLSATIDIPEISNQALDSENKSYYWQLTLFSASGTSSSNTASKDQNVSKVNFTEDCSSLTKVINYTINDEQNLLPLEASFNSTFNYHLGGGSVTKAISVELYGASFYEFCIDPNETYYVTSQIKLADTGYEPRIYQFVNQIYSHVNMQTQKLFLLNESFSSDIIIEVTDQGLAPQKDIIVNVSKFFESLGKYQLVESQVSDEFGHTIAKFIQNDAKYKFAFYTLNGILLKTSSSISIACRNIPCVLPFVLEDTTDEFERLENLTLYTGELSFDNTTNTFVYSWDDQRKGSATTRLEVTRYALNDSSTVCDTSSTSKLSAISCAVGDQKASYKAQVFRTEDGTENRIAILNIAVGETYSTYGIEGLFWVFILLLTGLGIGAFNPSAGVIIYGTGFIFFGLMGIISMPLTVFFANTAIVILFIWGFKT